MKRSIGWVAIALMVGVGCNDSTAPSLAGEWGGPQVTLTLAATGSTVQYACGSGTIDPGWAISSGGDWTATGQYYSGGGPVPSEGRPPHAAHYAGKVHGEQITFSVSVPDLPAVLGPFTATRGAPGAREMCL